MNIIKVGAAALNQTPLDWQKNLQNIIQAIEAARSENVSILCLPELAITGYGCEDAFYAPYVKKKVIETLLEIKEHTAGMVICVGLPIEVNNKNFNAACVLVDKNILGFSLKQHLPNYGLFYEDRWFHRWPAGVKEEISIKGFNYPVGDLIYEIDKIRIGIEICEDAWVPRSPGANHFDRGVEILLNPSASPFEFFKFQTREQLVAETSRSHNVSYIYTNLLGNESGRLIFDGDAMIAENGKLLASSPRFSYADFTLTTAHIDVDNNAKEQAKIKSNIVPYPHKVLSAFNFPIDISPKIQKATLESFEKGGYLKEEEFARAVSLGLFDYLRKSRSNGFTISLSGGADSSACTALCGLMLRLADESIGIENLKTKLAYIEKTKDCQTLEQLAKALIHTLYQGTENSSNDTYQSAQALAESIGATFDNVKIDTLVKEYTKLAEGVIDRDLSWQTDDITLQNIQARVRAPGIWMLANIHNHLLLATSNRSEVAVGYATMDGDTAGSISPLAGIDKHWLRSWLIWLETIGCEVNQKHIKIEGLKYVNALAPTAELRPKNAKQTDEADLMPYEFLNIIENAAVKENYSPLEAFKYLSVYFQEVYTKEDIYQWTCKFFKLWARNQWKRERYAPGFHVDNRNLDARSWCRFPILSGAYQTELSELKNYYEGNIPSQDASIGFKFKNKKS